MDRFQEILHKYCNTSIQKIFLGNVCRYINGIWYNRSYIVESSTKDAIGVLSTRNLFSENDSIDFHHAKYISNQVSIRDDQFLRKNDILICKEGSLNHIGKVGYVFEDSKFTFGGALGLLRANEDLVCPRYLYYVLSSDLFKKYLSESIYSGSSINRLNVETLNSFEAPLPSLDVQEKIACDLDVIETHIMRKKQEIATISTASAGEFFESLKDEDYYFDVEYRAKRDNNICKFDYETYKNRLNELEKLLKDKEIDEIPYDIRPKMRDFDYNNDSYVVVSYSRKDFVKVYLFLTQFYNEGYRFWYDNGMQGTKKWIEEYREKYENQNCLGSITFFSDNYISDSTKEEISIMYNTNGYKKLNTMISLMPLEEFDANKTLVNAVATGRISIPNANDVLPVLTKVIEEEKEKTIHRYSSESDVQCIIDKIDKIFNIRIHT